MDQKKIVKLSNFVVEHMCWSWLKCSFEKNVVFEKEQFNEKVMNSTAQRC